MLPAVVLLVFALLQFALVARDELLVVHAAREAARAASVGASGADGRGARAARARAVSISGGAEVGDLVVAVVSYHSVTDLPLVGPLIPDPWLHATVTMRTERVSGQ